MVAVIVPAAGTGTRMGGVRKPFLEINEGSLLTWGLAPFLTRADVVEVVVAVDAGSALSGIDDPRVRSVAGGGSRFESVSNALRSLGHEASIVVVHDGARPFPPPETIDRCIELARSGVGGVAGVPATDTVKQTTADGLVVATPDRGKLWYAQTPQAFPRVPFEEAMESCQSAGVTPTDDATAFELGGGAVQMVQASPRNLKVTYPVDLRVAQLLVDEGLV